MSELLEGAHGAGRTQHGIDPVMDGSQGAYGALRMLYMRLKDPQAREAPPGPPGSLPVDIRAAAAGARPRALAGGHGVGEPAQSALDRAEGTASLVNGTELLTRGLRIMRTFTVPHRQLALFMGLLRHCEVLPRGQGYSLEEQETLQKCAFIARAFGLEMGYEWYLNEYGTYSPFLAADHLELVEGNMQVDFGALVGLDEVPGYREILEKVREDGIFPAERFEAGRFISLVMGKDKGMEWLSVASTIVHERGSCPDDELLGRVSRINADYNEGLGRRVMADLERSRPPAWAGLPPGGEA